MASSKVPAWEAGESAAVIQLVAKVSTQFHPENPVLPTFQRSPHPRCEMRTKGHV